MIAIETTEVIKAIVIFAGGILCWPLLEYTLHRWLGHWLKGKNSFTKEHLRHHRETHYFAAWYKKAMAAVLVLVLAYLGLGLWLGLIWGLAFGSGLMLMYLFYEVVHRQCHVSAPKGFYGRWARRHHFYHHFHNPKMNHGVTSPIFDILFGTYVNPEKIRVDYELRGGKTMPVG